MLLRAGTLALAMAFAAPVAVQAQTIDLGGPQIDLRSKKQRMKDDVRERQARDQYRRSDRRGGDGYGMRDRDIPTGSTRRYDNRGDRYDSDRRRGW